MGDDNPTVEYDGIEHDANNLSYAIERYENSSIEQGSGGSIAAHGITVMDDLFGNDHVFVSDDRGSWGRRSIEDIKEAIEAAMHTPVTTAAAEAVRNALNSQTMQIIDPDEAPPRPSEAPIGGVIWAEKSPTNHDHDVRVHVNASQGKSMNTHKASSLDFGGFTVNYLSFKHDANVTFCLGVDDETAFD